MRLAIFLMTAYLACRIGGPAALKLWNSFIYVHDRSQWARSQSYTTKNQFCLSIHQPETADPVVLRVANWVYTVSHLYKVMWMGQMQMVKLAFALLVLLVPSAIFKLVVVAALIAYKWIELGLDLHYALEILIFLSAVVVEILRRCK